jgi:hypothetical protein
MQVRGLLHVAKGLGQLQAAIACILHKADPGNLDQCELADDERVWAVIVTLAYVQLMWTRLTQFLVCFANL